MAINGDLKASVKACVEVLERAASGEYDGEECEDVYSALVNVFEDALDVNFIIDADKCYRGVVIMLTFGGPTIYLDTREGYVKGYWGSEFAEYHVNRLVLNVIDEFWNERAEMLFGIH